MQVASNNPPKPAWMKRPLPRSVGLRPMKNMLRELKLVTVCEEARCPNAPECFSRGTSTFMILGDVCTRKCGFCAVSKGRPLPPAPDEPGRVAEAVRLLKLRHAVITSVDRDDLKDGGATHWAATIAAVKQAAPATTVEVLTPDFQGKEWQIDLVIAAAPHVYNHNIETVPSQYLRVRPGARYERSLSLLQRVASKCKDTRAKSGIMLGLGETRAEVLQVFRDLRDHGVEILTVGQYLAPTAEGKLPITRFIPPEEFDNYRYEAMLMGFSSVAAGPYVRSSYHAEESFLLSASNASGA